MGHPLLVRSDQLPAPTYDEAFADLANVYLEDSWVLGIERSTSALIFTLDLVLTPTHPAFRAPRAHEQHCYRRATMRLDSDSALLVRLSSAPPAVDATGEADYGTIDVFCLADGSASTTWELVGEWGEALVSQPRVCVEFYNPASPDGRI
jgi:hypothetical protein